MMVIVICFENIAAASCYSLWKWCNGRGVRRSISGHKSDRCECKREDHSFHFLTSLRSESPPYVLLEACVPECPLNKIRCSDFYSALLLYARGNTPREFVRGSVAAVWLAGALMHGPARWAAACESAMEVRIVAPIRVPIGTSPISVPITMVLIMPLREAGSATNH